MANPKLKAEERKLTGRKVKQLRNKGILPANIYGAKIKSLAVSVNLKEFEEVYKEVGETGLVDLIVDGKKKPVLVHDTQIHPITDKVIHADFLQVDLRKKVTANIPLEIVGEAPAEKQGLGTLVHYINEVEVEALPNDLPEKYEVDVSHLDDTEMTIVVGDIKVDKKKVALKADKEQIIAKVEAKQEEKEEEQVVSTEGEGGTEDDEKKEGEGVEKKEEKETDNGDKKED